MILLCYDRSVSAKRAIAVAHETLADKPAMVLHVWTPPAAFLAADAFGLSSAASGQSIVAFERVALNARRRSPTRVRARAPIGSRRVLVATVIVYLVRRRPGGDPVRPFGSRR